MAEGEHAIKRFTYDRARVNTVPRRCPGPRGLGVRDVDGRVLVAEMRGANRTSSRPCSPPAG